MAVASRLKVRLGLRGSCFALKNNIAAGNVGMDITESGVRAHGLQIAHGKLAGSPHVYGAQQCNVLGHVANILGIKVRNG
jgi:hypothetical protein